MNPLHAQIFGSTFSPRDQRTVQSRVPQIPGQQSTFSQANESFLQQRLPPYASQTRSRIDMGAMAAGFDYGNNGGILPRAIHALNNRSEPSNLGAIVAQQQGFNAVMHGFYGVAGLNGAGCTSTGANAAMAAMSAGGGVLTSLSPTLTTTKVQTGTDVGLPAPVQAPSRATTVTAVTGALLNMGATLYGGICTARTGVAPPGMTTGSQIASVTNTLISGIQQSRTQQAAATTPSDTAAATAAANPNSASGAAAAGNPPAASSNNNNNTMMYVGIGAVALLGLALVLRK